MRRTKQHPPSYVFTGEHMELLEAILLLYAASPVGLGAVETKRAGESLLRLRDGIKRATAEAQRATDTSGGGAP